jgi:hypothetical protein
MSAAPLFRTLSAFLTIIILTLVNADADLIYQPAGATPDWKEAAALLLDGNGYVWNGLAAFERGHQGSAKELIASAITSFTKASKAYSAISKDITHLRTVDFEKLEKTDPGLKASLQAGLASFGLPFPTDDMAGADLGYRQLTAFLTWLKDNDKDISALKIRTLQTLMLEVAKITWAGTTVAIMMQDGLPER